MTIANLALKRETAARNIQTFRVQTSRFGELEVDPELVIDMPEGLIGFDRCRRYVVITPGEGGPFRWFQSLDDGGIAFPIIEPSQFRPDYQPSISDGDARRLGLSHDTPKLVFSVVTIPKLDPRTMTANLLAPLIINAATRLGRQVIVTDEQYNTRHSIVEEMRRLGSGDL